MPTALTDEAPAGLQRTMDAAQRGIQIRNPVEHRVGEHRVELALERQRLRVDLARVDAAGRGRGHEVGRRIHADHRGASLHEPFRERAVAAADVEDALTRARREQVEHRLPEIRHEPRVGGVVGRVPRLGHHVCPRSVVVELRAVVVAGARQELEEGVEAAVERPAELRNGAVDRVEGQPGFFAVGQLQPGVTGVLQGSFGTSRMP
jgi:hypothetical protein